MYKGFRLLLRGWQNSERSELKKFNNYLQNEENHKIIRYFSSDENFIYNQQTNINSKFVASPKIINRPVLIR